MNATMLGFLCFQMVDLRASCILTVT